MKSGKKAVVIFMAVISACLTTFMTVSAQYGAASVRESETYKLAQMLTVAIEDEYLAAARYTADIAKFGNVRPFNRIAEAEKRHVALLKPMLVKYNVPVPEDRSAQYITVPESLAAAIKAGVEGERENMRMYGVFLKQELPEDVKLVFTLLRNAAENHLRAFERNLARLDGAPPRGGRE